MKRWSTALVALVTGMLLLGGVTAAVAAPPKIPDLQGRASAKAPPIGRQPKLEAVFVPIKPCRIVDTRSSSAGEITPNSVRNFRVRGTTSMAGQGGSTTGCGVPNTATGVTANTTMTMINTGGFLSNYPAGGVASTTNFTSFVPGPNVTSNPTFALAPAGVEPSLAIKASGSARLDLIIDVTGYYAPQIEGMINASGGLYSGSPSLLTATRSAVGTYSLTVDRDVSNCSVAVQAYSYGLDAQAYLFNGTNVSVYSYSRNGGTVTPADDYVYVNISC